MTSIRALFYVSCVAFGLLVVVARAAPAQPLVGDCNCNGSYDAADPVCAVLRVVGAYNETCLSQCGNGVVEVGEDCDFGDLNGATCVTVGLAGDGLTCGPGCVFDTSECLNPLCPCEGKSAGGATWDDSFDITGGCVATPAAIGPGLTLDGAAQLLRTSSVPTPKCTILDQTAGEVFEVEISGGGRIRCEAMLAAIACNDGIVCPGFTGPCPPN